MKTNKRDSTRRKILTILPRRTLDVLSRHERPHTLTLPQLLDECIKHWHTENVKDALDRVFHKATR